MMATLASAGFLVNMIPQEPNNNRHLWEGIESGTRNFAVSNGSVYVVTGPLFSGKKISFLNDRVAVPTQIFKLLYDPIHKSGGVFLVDNIVLESDDSGHCRRIPSWVPEDKDLTPLQYRYKLPPIPDAE